MPCAKCGQPLLAHHDKEDLRCPHCLGLETEDSATLHKKADKDRELLRDDNILQLMEDFSKDNLLLYLIERLNKISYNFYENRALDQREFTYLNYLIKTILPEDREKFGDKYLNRGQDLDDRIDTLLDTQAKLVTGLNHVEDQFRICIKLPVPQHSGSKFLFGDYQIYDSEYRYCHFRCLDSLTGAEEENLEQFDKLAKTIRDFNTPSADEIDTLKDFGLCFFEFINALLFKVAGDEVAGDIYTTFPPDHVTVFNIKQLLTRIDHQFTDQQDKVVLQDSTLGMTTEAGLNEAGEDVFGENWSEVKESLVISQDNLDAHPFLFKIPVEKVVKQPSGRPPVTTKKTRIVYPRYYATLLRYQIFPLLQNGGQDHGHEILKQVATERGLEFERNLYQHLTNEDFNCFHSAEIPGVESSEIDILVTNTGGKDEEEVPWFIECKYLLPETDMNTAKGIQNLNAKFDHKVFNEEVDAYEGSPSGQTFPDKVEEWTCLNQGAEFKWQREPEPADKTCEQFQGDWLNQEPRMMVVSNLVPSYVKKNGVEFFTDMEFLKLIEGENPVYPAKHSMQ